MLNRFITGSILFVVVLMTLDAVGAEFNTPFGKWWRHEGIAQRLGLSLEEINQLDAAFQESRRKMIALKSTVEIEQFELETLIENPVLDEPAVLSQHEKLETARGALGTERFRFFLSVRKIIGHVKFQKLLTIKKKKNRQQLRQP